MKKYINPEIKVVQIALSDIITTSPGTETSVQDENDGVWDLNIGL